MNTLARLSLAPFCLLLCSITYAKTYTVGVENIIYYPAYTYESGKFGGYGRAILDAFAESKGYDFEYEAYPIKRLYSNFLNGKLDFKYPDNANWKQDSKKGRTVYYSLPAGPYTDGVMVRPDEKNISVEQLKTLGTVLGFTAWDYLGLASENKVKLVESPSYGDLINKIINNQIDGLYSNIAVARYQLGNLAYGDDALVFNPNLPHTSDSYKLSTIEYPDIITEFNNFLEQEKELVSELENKFKLHYPSN